MSVLQAEEKRDHLACSHCAIQKPTFTRAFARHTSVRAPSPTCAAAYSVMQLMKQITQKKRPHSLCSFSAFAVKAEMMQRVVNVSLHIFLFFSVQKNRAQKNKTRLFRCQVQFLFCCRAASREE